MLFERVEFVTRGERQYWQWRRSQVANWKLPPIGSKEHDGVDQSGILKIGGARG